MSTTNRLNLARPAVRPALKARAMLSGPPGAGKTRSALITAEVLAEGGTVLVIDTEKESALTYADDFTFDHLPWDPPFEPRALGATILEAGVTYAVVVIDSASHFWRGDGGTLDIAAGKFTGWKDARPAQLDLVDAILRCQAHVIVCSRSKVEHVQETVNGKQVVRKLGMAVIQDDDLEYELNVAIELDMDHSMTVSKSRTIAVPVGRNFKAGHAEDFAAVYRDWLKGGEPPAPQATVEDIKARLNALPDPLGASARSEFRATFGRPDHLTEAQVPDALDLVAKFEDHPEPPAPGSVPATDPTAPGSGGGDAEPSPQVGGDPDGSSQTNAPAEPGQGSVAAEPPEDEHASGGDAANRDGIGVKDLAKLADQAFPLTKDDAPPRRLTWAKKRLRYTVTSALTKGRTVHLDELTPEEAVKLWGRLRDFTEGRSTWGAGEDGLEVYVANDTEPRVLPWVDPDNHARREEAA